MCKDSRGCNWIHTMKLQTLFPLRSPRALRLMEKFLSLAFFAGEGNLCSRSAFCVQSTTERSPLNSERKMTPAIIALLLP